MKLFSASLLLGGVLLAGPAPAQTQPTKLPTHRVTRPMPRKPRPAPGAAKSTTDKGDVVSGYAAPGMPINVQDNGKKTPPYDGPAAGRNASKGMTMPNKQ